MSITSEPKNLLGETEKKSNKSNTEASEVLKFKKRILKWPNPVEYVNNMYGCHPDDNKNDYFKAVFGK